MPKKEDKYIDEINARGLDFPEEDIPYGGKVGTVIGPQGATTTVVLGDEAPNIPALTPAYIRALTIFR